MNPGDYDRFAVVLFASPAIRHAVEEFRRQAPPSGRPMMAAHVTVKGSFVEPTDMQQISDWTRHCCAASEPMAVHVGEPEAWRNETAGLASIALIGAPSAALIRLHWHLVEHLRHLATTDYYGEDIGSFLLHLTLVQDIPLGRLDEALHLIEQHRPAYTFEASEAALCGRRRGVMWEPIEVYPLGDSRNQPRANGVGSA